MAKHRPRATLRTGRSRRRTGSYHRKARAANIEARKRAKSFVKPDDWPTGIIYSTKKER